MSRVDETDYMIYDATTGDLLDGPMNYQHARYLVERDSWQDGKDRHDPIAMARKGEMRRIQDSIARTMSGNPPRDLRRARD